MTSVPTAAAIDPIADAIALARAIHADPELSRAEHRASRACAELLARAGFTVAFGAGELDTAFRATRDSGMPGPRVAILAEYDALPEIGHGCGHNLIAGASVAAALMLAARALPNGAIELLGCPAEEISFGKRAMLRAGMFDGITSAIAVHGAPFCAPMRTCTAVRAQTYAFRGAPAHAGMAPWEGRNALDAAVAFYGATAQVRQHAHDAERVHGVILDGGEAWNVVPERAVVRVGVRAATGERADMLLGRLDAAAHGAATMHACELETSDLAASQPLRYDAAHAEIVAGHLRAAGLDPGEPVTVGAATDVGDVSEVVPTVLFFAPTWPQGTEFHTAQATAASDAPQAYREMITAAEVIAATIADIHAGAAPTAGLS